MPEIYDAYGRVVSRVDCTVNVDRCESRANKSTDSYKDWNLPPYFATFEKRLLSILKDNGGQMHFQDFLREFKRRYDPYG